MRRIILLSTISLLVFTSIMSAQDTVGSVTFVNSGAPAAQPAFLRGLALLHNFEYNDAAESFRAAEAADPQFAMAYWGEAMTYNHPIWMQQDRDAALAALKKLGATPEERARKAPSPRERDYLQALEILYGEGSKAERDFKYADAMAALHAKYPYDVDATAFYALSLLGTAHEGRDVRTYMRAAALLEEVFPTNRNHPGVLHYLIHSYDDPIHAPLGVRAARLYGAVAPDAGHALHMTSHIFVALGDWDEVIEANRRAIAVVNAHRAASGKPPSKCGHYPDWLQYAYLQEGKSAEAKQVLSECRAAALPEKMPDTPAEAQLMTVDSWASMRAFAVIDGGELDTPSYDLTGDDYVSPRFTLLYADALAAAAKKDLKTLRDRARALHDVAPSMNAWLAKQQETGAAMRARPSIIQQQIDGLLLLREGKRDAGLDVLRRAAEAESAAPMEFGPPFVEKPSWELLGDELLAAGRAADAEAAYKMALDRAPGRSSSLRGLMKAQLAAGHKDGAAATKALLDKYER